MRKINYIMIILFCFSILFMGCSSQVMLKTKSLQNEQTVKIEQKNGAKVQGVVKAVDNTTVTVLDKKNSTVTIQKSDILSVKGPKPYYDSANRIISSAEIDNVKTNNNFWLYTLSGGALSAGASFFLSSMIARSSGENSDAPVITTGTVAGAIVGGYFFSRLGKSKDNVNAVEAVRLNRGVENLKGIDEEQNKQTQVQDEIDKEKQKKANLEAEMEKLKKQLDEKK